MIPEMLDKIESYTIEKRARENIEISKSVK